MKKQFRNNITDVVRAPLAARVPTAPAAEAAPLEGQHVNVSRYINGICPKYREKQMQNQLRTLLDVNDGYTLPNPNGTGGRAVRSRIVLPRLITRA